jgi:hypothetical protein
MERDAAQLSAADGVAERDAGVSAVCAVAAAARNLAAALESPSAEEVS